MNMLEMPGVQMLLTNLIKGAAPDLLDKVNDMGQVLLAFKQQLDRIETQNVEILSALKQENSPDGKAGTGNRGLESAPQDDGRTSVATANGRDE